MQISEYLRQHRVHFDLLLHRPTSCASRRAHCLHIPGHQVAKGVLLRSGGRGLLAVLPATHRIDLGRLGAALQTPGLVVADESDLDQVFVGCEHGALPPFGSCFGLMTVVDATLAGASKIVAESNLRHLSVRLSYRDFEALERPLRCRFAVPAALPPQPDRHRRAG